VSHPHFFPIFHTDLHVLKSANNIPNTYSTGLSMQALGRPFAMIPRFFWVCLAFLIYTVAGVAGREHFSAILSNFLSILSYWTAFFVVIVAEEHFLFRRPGGVLGGYNLGDWDRPSKYVFFLLWVAGVLTHSFLCLFCHADSHLA
jgi:purine-cytosine permease-like protein